MFGSRGRKLIVPLLSRRFASSTIGDDRPGIVKSHVPSVQIPRLPVPNFIWEKSCSNHGDKTALVNGITGKFYTYSEAFELSKKFGSALIKKGYCKNDVMAVMLPNSPDYILAISGAMGAGLISTTINPIYVAAEVARQLSMSRAKLAITNLANFHTVTEASNQLGLNMEIIVVDSEDCGLQLPHGAQSFQAMLTDDGSAYPTEIPPDFDFDNDVALLPYSSGTTGLPKGVLVTHGNLVSNMVQVIYPKMLDFIKFAEGDFQPKTVCVLPMFHMFGLNVTSLPTLHAGGQIVTLPSFEAKSFIRALETVKPNFMHFAPPLVQFCAYSPDVKPHHLESLDYVMIGAAPCGEALANKFKEKAPNCQFREGWGMTETGPVGTTTPSNQELLGSCGILVANTEAKIVDLDTGLPLGPLQKGELCIRGPQIMKGYLDNEEATKNTLKDGWLHSGDIGYYDEKHRFFIVDRLKELIKVKGFQVAPAELEDLLRNHPKVQDVAVIGIPHDRFGEVPKAYIVKKYDNECTQEEIQQFVAAQAAEYKQLKGGVEFIDKIPKSAAGKILRKELRALVS